MSSKNFDIIYFTLFPWDHPYSSVSLSFTKEFAKKHRVFYINRPYTLKDFILWFFRKEVKKRRKALLKNQIQYESIPGLPTNAIAIQPTLALPINWLPKGKLYQLFYQFNNQILLKAIQKIIQDFEVKNFIFINCFNPFYTGHHPSSKLNIYQCIDDMSQEKYTAKHGPKLEQIIMQNADMVLVTSKHLHQLKAVFNPHTYILNNAADTQLFKKAYLNQYSRPIELKNRTGKVIGFVGNLDQNRIDYTLLKDIATYFPNDQLLLIGPINNKIYQSIGLDECTNVIFTGSKKLEQLPNYLQYIDCAIIPFLCNQLTKSIYPIKINEYLAAGKPVVSTSFSEDIQGFKDYIYLAENRSHFLQLIKIAIQEDSQEKVKQRITKAESNSWEERVKKFWRLIDTVIC